MGRVKTSCLLSYEMTTILTALLKDSFMRKPNKAEMANELHREQSNVTGHIAQSDVYVVGGGWLLHRIGWTDNYNYQDIFSLYSPYSRQ